MEPITRDEAKKRKYLKYWNGKPCRHGHICMRYTSSNKCLVCVSLQSAFWYRAADKKERTRIPLKLYVYPSEVDIIKEFAKNLKTATELNFLLEEDNARRNARNK